MECACGGEEALERISTDGPFAVVVSDMNMPGMNGIQFLAKVRSVAPDTVRMMFTGTDQSTAVEAINKGEILRFLTKPSTTEVLDAALEAGLAQYRQTIAERNLLSGTLIGTIKLLSEVLAAARPVAFGRTERVRVLVRRLAKKAAPTLMWRAELAALLSQIGCIGLSEEVLTKAYAGKQIVARDAELFREHPQIGRNSSVHEFAGVQPLLHPQHSIRPAIPIHDGIFGAHNVRARAGAVIWLRGCGRP
jgi:response regulator RpfG family c-di-GMP phosphodiesterase